MKQSPQWLKQRELTFKRTGKLNLTSAPVDDLSKIGTRSSLRELNLSRCKIESLKGLHRQPAIKSFIADNSELSSLENIRSIASCSILSMKNTPVSQKKNFSLAIAIIFGSNITSLNNKKLSLKLISKAQKFPEVAADLINAGWDLVCPFPEGDELKAICEEYNVKYPEEDQVDNSCAEEESHFSAFNEGDEPFDFREEIERLTEEHNNDVENYARKFADAVRLYGRPNGCDFKGQLRNLLERYRYQFDDSSNVDQQLEDAVSQLCEMKKQAEATEEEEDAVRDE